VNADTGKVNDYRRTVAKHAAFGIINGITEKGLVNYMILNRCRRPDGEPWTEDDCIQLLKEWFSYYRGVKRFHNDCMEETRQTGLARESIGGRVIYLPQIWSPIKSVRETAERMSYVMHTQGGGQTVIKKAMKVVWKEVCKVAEFHADPLLQMHDELLLEMPERKPIMDEVDRLMVGALCNTTKLRIPIKASGGYGKTWLEAH
jgi:DNA polymerase I